MEKKLFDSGFSLEEAFFRKRDVELIEQHRKLEKIKRTRETLSEISGIHNAKVLDKLIELDVSPQVLSSMAVVPLVEVAWADGKIDDNQRAAILVSAEGNGIGKGSTDHALLENWLKHRSPAKLLDAWMHYIAGLCEIMNEEERNAFRKDLIGRARKVAGSSGGVLGLVKISSEEQAILKTMESAFSLRG